MIEQGTKDRVLRVLDSLGASKEQRAEVDSALVSAYHQGKREGREDARLLEAKRAERREKRP